jgi:aspartate decarboxylase
MVLQVITIKDEDSLKEGGELIYDSLRQMLKSKIHGATITKKELYYSGRIGIDKALLLKSGMHN